jgi:hypothetical protein
MMKIRNPYNHTIKLAVVDQVGDGEAVSTIQLGPGSTFDVDRYVSALAAMEQA